MSTELAQLLPTLRELKRAEKLYLIQFLVSSLAQEETELLQAGVAYPMWSPYDAFGAADVMFKALDEAKLSDQAHDRHIVITPGTRGGKPRVAGRRITVADIATWYLQQNRSVHELVQEFDLTHAQIHAALAYYYDHRAEIDEREAADLTTAEAIKQQYPSKLQTKLSQRG